MSIENESPASCQTTVMSSLVKPLNWIDNPEKRFGDIYKVMSRADIPMPPIAGNARIEITEQTCPHKYYEATLWCFSQGTYIAEGKSVDEAKSKAFKWWSDFVCGFLYCPLKNETTNGTKPVLTVVAIDRKKDFYDKDEIYCNWYKCPSCGNTYVRSGDNFCSNCGCKFEWSGNYY